jgi:hypothetical protein
LQESTGTDPYWGVSPAGKIPDILPAMRYETTRLQEIDFSDETCRISEDLNPGRLETSLRAVGQVTPVVLARQGGGTLIIVCGFRRLHAMRRLGLAEASARVEDGSTSPPDLLSLALFDNLSHRTLTCFESARVLSKLAECGVPDGVLLSRFMPALGLNPRPAVLAGYRSLNSLSDGLRALVLADRLTETSALRLAAMPREIQAQFARILQRIRLSATLQRKFLDLVDELGAMATGGITRILDDADLSRLLDEENLSLPQKGEQAYDFLYRRRYPRLSRAHEHFRQHRETLGLPGSIAIAPDPYFETARVRFSFEASDADQFRWIVAALASVGNHSSLPELFGVREG